MFAVNCPPYASVYLGAASTARLAAFWAASGLGVPAERDHLTTLLGLYACLGEAASESAELGQAGLRQAQFGQAQFRQVLFLEHLWPWLPAYLGAVSDLPAGTLTPWAKLTV